ncbi:MAG: hypothetical protein AB7F79_01690 [Steroidobacteraceae bacterium]
MKFSTEHIKRVGLALIALSSVGLLPSAFAAVGETTAGATISNTATVNYTVGTVPQAQVASNNGVATTFLVDKKVDLTVSNDGGATTVPGATLIGLPFTVTNTGNASDTFTLAAANVTTGDQFDVTSYAIYIDVNNDNAYDAGDTLVTAPVTIARDTALNVIIVSTMPGGVVNGNTANMTLTATTTSVATTGAESPTVVDVVFADAGNNGTEVDTNTYTIVTATLAVVKSAAVLADPINCPTGVGSCGTNLPKALPGATVRYTIVVTNSGTASATAVTLTDNIPANTTYVANSMTLNAAALTDASDADAGTTTGAPVVTSVSVNAGTVAAAGNATVTFNVTVN